VLHRRRIAASNHQDAEDIVEPGRKPGSPPATSSPKARVQPSRLPLFLDIPANRIYKYVPGEPAQTFEKIRTGQRADVRPPGCRPACEVKPVAVTTERTVPIMVRPASSRKQCPNDLVHAIE
jgi:hypothetical protein